MKPDIIRAWKDEIYRRSLSTEQQAMLPVSPIGGLELSDHDLEIVQGGLADSIVIATCTSANGNCNSWMSNCISTYSNGSCNVKF